MTRVNRIGLFGILFLVTSSSSQLLEQCQQGQGGCIKCSTLTGNCIECDNGYYVLTNGRCGPCLDNCEYCTNGVFCVTCKSGTIKNDFNTECVEFTSGGAGVVLIVAIVFIAIIVCGVCFLAYKRDQEKKSRRVNSNPHPPPIDRKKSKVMMDTNQPRPPNQIQIQPQINNNQIGQGVPMPNQAPTPLLIGAGHQGIPPQFSFLGNSLLSKYGNLGTFVLTNCQYVGLYFSASWCGPCRSFTPKLAQFYQQANGNNPAKILEIVFISSDRNINGFNAYYGKMPWLAIPFGSPVNQNVKSRYPVSGIPKLVILNSQGLTVSDDGRYDISNYSVNDCAMKWSSSSRF